jgi:hypothetical protein
MIHCAAGARLGYDTVLDVQCCSNKRTTSINTVVLPMVCRRSASPGAPGGELGGNSPCRSAESAPGSGSEGVPSAAVVERRALSLQRPWRKGVNARDVCLTVTAKAGAWRGNAKGVAIEQARRGCDSRVGECAGPYGLVLRTLRGVMGAEGMERAGGGRCVEQSRDGRFCRRR